MIYHLLWYLRAGERFGFYAYQNVLFRSVSATLTSLLIALFIGPKIIRWLMRKKIGDRPEFHHATLNELTKEKANTPTMGGLIIILSVIGSTLLWAKLYNPEQGVCNPYVVKAIFLMVWFGALGGADDWLKLTSGIRHRSRDGSGSAHALASPAVRRGPRGTTGARTRCGSARGRRGRVCRARLRWR